MLLARDACECASQLLKHYLKADAPGPPGSLDSPSDFDVATVRMATDLHRKAISIEMRALVALLPALNIDWTTTTPPQQHNIVSRAIRDAASELNSVGNSVTHTMDTSATNVFRAAKNDLRRIQRLKAPPTFTALDARMLRFLRQSETLFVRDQYGRRMAALGTRIRQLVAEGLELGLGRDDIRTGLAQAATNMLTHTEGYWQVVAGAFIGRGRSYAQMSCYYEAGIKHYRVVAVMDERTSAVCRRMHGKRLSVQTGVETFLRAETAKDPSVIMALNPWPRRDATHADSDLSFPPYHALCRTTTVAES